MKNEKKNETKSTALTVCKMNDEFAISAADTGATVRVSTTFDDVTLFNAVQGSSEPAKNFLDKTVEVANIIVTSANIAVDINEPDGEKESKPVVHFFTVDGHNISSVSNGIIKATKSIFECGFEPNENRTITIKFHTIETKRGIAHTFDLISINNK